MLKTTPNCLFSTSHPKLANTQTRTRPNAHTNFSCWVKRQRHPPDSFRKSDLHPNLLQINTPLSLFDCQTHMKASIFSFHNHNTTQSLACAHLFETSFSCTHIYLTEKHSLQKSCACCALPTASYLCLPLLHTHRFERPEHRPKVLDMPSACFIMLWRSFHVHTIWLDRPA